MIILYLILIFVLGTIIGSFLSAFSYRLPKKENFIEGRSHCDICGKKISWYDNIPLFSYILLGGKCRNCGKKISLRYPLIEVSTGILFLSLYIFGISENLGIFLTAYNLIIASILIAIFIIDFENQFIPDQLVFLLIGLGVFVLFITANDMLYQYLLSGFAASGFLLLINIITKGRGMGLGDVKLALFAGIYLGFPNVITWLFISFISGAVIGVFLIALGKAEFGKQIAFGPFLVGSLFLTIFCGEFLTSIFLPYFY